MFKDTQRDSPIQSYTLAANHHAVYKFSAEEIQSAPQKLRVYWIVPLITELYAIKYLLKGMLFFFVGVDNGCVYTLKFLPRSY